MSSKNQLKPLTFSLALFTIIGLTGCSSAETPSSQQESSATVEAEETGPEVGTPVTDGKIEFVINSVNCTTDPMDDDQFAPLAPKGQFCLVNVSATALANIGMYLGEVTISTTNGEEDVTPSVGASMYAGVLKADYIDKGETLEGNVVFDIAADDSVSSVTLRQSALTDGVTVPIS